MIEVIKILVFFIVALAGIFVGLLTGFSIKNRRIERSVENRDYTFKNMAKKEEVLNKEKEETEKKGEDQNTEKEETPEKTDNCKFPDLEDEDTDENGPRRENRLRERLDDKNSCFNMEDGVESRSETVRNAQKTQDEKYRVHTKKKKP